MGLGSAMPGQISLAEARDMARAARKKARAGVDPITEREAVVEASRIEAARSTTFRAAAEGFIEAHKDGWKSDKHAGQWSATLKTYAYPVLEDLAMSAITTEHIEKVLQPIWRTKRETANRVRGRIEQIWDWARVKDFHSGTDNPARWLGNMKIRLGETKSARKRRKVRHHPALPYDQMPVFYAALVKQEGVSASALAFTILTCARTSETIGMRFSEIDWDDKVWTVPPERMKADREHRIPLADDAMAILKRMKAEKRSEYVFPGAAKRVRKAADTTDAANTTEADGKSEGQPLSNMAMAALLDRMDGGWKDDKGQPITVHGFRSTFRDWAAHETNVPREIAEMALAHVVADETERAYQRGDLLKKRRELQTAWAKFCVSKV
jgi:integrase